jgi:hypothetical protein
VPALLVVLCRVDGVAVAPPSTPSSRRRVDAIDATHSHAWVCVCVCVCVYFKDAGCYVSSIISSSEPTARGDPRMSSILSLSSLSFSSWGLKTSWFRINSCSMSK